MTEYFVISDEKELSNVLGRIKVDASQGELRLDNTYIDTVMMYTISSMCPFVPYCPVSSRMYTTMCHCAILPGFSDVSIKMNSAWALDQYKFWCKFQFYQMQMHGQGLTFFFKEKPIMTMVNIDFLNQSCTYTTLSGNEEVVRILYRNDPIDEFRSKVLYNLTVAHIDLPVCHLIDDESNVLETTHSLLPYAIRSHTIRAWSTKEADAVYLSFAKGEEIIELKPPLNTPEGGMEWAYGYMHASGQIGWYPSVCAEVRQL